MSIRRGNSRRTALVLWMLPVSWLVHDLEEIATIGGWSRRWKHSKRNDISTVQ